MSKKLPIMTTLQMWRDYLRFVTSLQKQDSLHLGVGLSLFIISIYFLQQDLFFPSEKGSEHTISIVLVLVVLQFLWDMYNNTKEVNEYFNIQHSILRNPSNTNSLVPSPKERAMDFESITVDSKKNERVFVSHTLNRYIQTTPLTISMNGKKKEKIQEYLEKHKELLLQYLNYYFFSSLKNNRVFTNDEKFCLSNDLSLHSHQAVCHTGGYYDSFLTNQISGTTLIIKDKKNTTISTEEIFPSLMDEEQNHYLSDIASSSMNHHIGASTLGWSRDHKWIVWIQGETNQFGSGLLITTGSGSANASDMKNNNFQETIIRAMERELHEESVSRKKVLRQYKTLLLGFYRWVSRGGKPEFVGITKLPENAEYYHPNTNEVDMRKIEDHVFHMPTINSLPDVIEKIKKSGSLSLPLFMCLRELNYMYEHHKEELETFLFEKTE